MCHGKPLPTYFYPNKTTISLYKSVLHEIPQIVFGACQYCCLVLGVVDFNMIKELSTLITRPCESPWSSHCIASRKGPDVALWKSLCAAWIVWRYMTFHIWCDVYVEFIYLLYLVDDKYAWTIDISFVVLFIYYVRCHTVSYIPTIYVYICLVFDSLSLHYCTCGFMPVMIWVTHSQEKMDEIQDPLYCWCLLLERIWSQLTFD